MVAVKLMCTSILTNRTLSFSKNLRLINLSGSQGWMFGIQGYATP